MVDFFIDFVCKGYVYLHASSVNYTSAQYMYHYMCRLYVSLGIVQIIFDINM